jgi:predicted phage terminase large subunit-like protein
VKTEALRREVERLRSTLGAKAAEVATAAEQARRRAARTSLLDFTRLTFPTYRPDRAHTLIAGTLGAVVRGELHRLMIFAPPQHGKSQLVSIQLPAFWLGRRPNDPVILTSYAASLAESMSRQARGLVEAAEFQALFPGITTRRDSRAVDRWELAGCRGGMLAVGVGGPVTGHGGLLGIIDDPFENYQEAMSPTIRDKVWEWYRTTFRTRLWEGGSIVLVMTRWHENDLAGRLLAEQPGEWAVLRLPALAETQDERDANNRRLGLPLGEPDPLGRPPGEPLCPRRFSREALEVLRRDVGGVAWAGQYQGTPRAPEGNRFQRAWFPLVDAAPFAARRVRFWDKASSEGHGDFTAGLLLARTEDGVYWVEDLVRGQWSSGTRDAVMLRTAEQDARRYDRAVETWVEQEPGSSGKDSAVAAVRLLAGYAVRLDRVTGSKEVRAEPFASQAEAGCVRLVRGPWNRDFLDEVTTFPHGAHDDIVDAAAGAFTKLALGTSRFYQDGQPLVCSPRPAAEHFLEPDPWERRAVPRRDEKPMQALLNSVVDEMAREDDSDDGPAWWK